jgi:hypothetical protein
MLKTVEHFAFNKGWITKKQFLADLGVATWENPRPGTRLNVRLMRYTRSGLLQRRRTKQRYEYEYRLSPKGLDRYIYLLTSRGLLDAVHARTNNEKESMLTRIRLCRLLLLERREALRRELGTEPSLP